MRLKWSSLYTLLCASLLFVGCSETPRTVDEADNTDDTGNKAVVSVEDDKKLGIDADAIAKVEFANEFCPIMFHAISGEGETSTWNDKTIGYCCDGCKAKFEKLNGDEKEVALAKADAAAKKEKESSDAAKPETKEAAPAEGDKTETKEATPAEAAKAEAKEAAPTEGEKKESKE